MSAKMTLGNFLERLEGVYKSIDVRIAAVKSNDTWHNALTVVRFSYMEPEDLKQQQKQLQEGWGRVQTSSFRVEMQGLVFGALEALKLFFDEGNWRLLEDPAEKLHFGRNINLLSLDGRFESYGHTRREIHSWPCFEAYTGEHCYKLDNKQLQSEVKSQTYFDLYSLISELLEVDFHKDLGLDLIVNAPFYAMIGEENIDLAEQKCKIRVKFHKDIKALAVSAIVRRADRDDSPVRDKADSPIKLEDAEKLDEYMRLWTKELELPNATPADHLFWNLMQTEPALLDIEKPSFPKQISRFAESKKPAKTPLVATFLRFCSLDKLEEYLAKPTQAELLKKSKKDASATFELAVAWLLGLCGFNIIWLGQTMHEVLKENNVTLFSIDMLASHHESNNLLLLIGCTIGSPNDKDIDALKSIRRILQDEVFKGTKLHIKPFVFSAAPELGNKERNGVKVLDADDIRKILNYVRQREIGRALNECFGYELGFTRIVAKEKD